MTVKTKSQYYNSQNKLLKYDYNKQHFEFKPSSLKINIMYETAIYLLWRRRAPYYGEEELYAHILEENSLIHIPK